MDLPNVANNSNNLKATKKFDLSKVFTYGVPAVAIGISLFILIFLIWPKLSESLKIRSANAELVSRISALSGKVDVLKSLDQATLSQQAGLSDAILPSDKSPFTFVRQLEFLASQTGVKVNKIDVVPGLLGGGGSSATSTVATTLVTESAPKIQVRISIFSDYNSMINFLSSLYALPRVVGIRDLSLTNTVNGTDGSSTLSAAMVLDAYYKSLPTKLGSIEATVETLNTEDIDVLSRAVDFLESSRSAGQPDEVPNVPTGRSDLFSPF